MAPVLQIENLTKSYGYRILFSEISIGVQEGDKIGLIAKNGTGKSTLLKIISGIEDYDSGSVTFRNDLRVGYLEQVPKFNKEMTLSQFIDGFSDDPEKRNSLLHLVTRMSEGMDADTSFGKMSGGQLKRVALAAALADKPDFLILDEPTNHLDIRTIEWLEGYLSRERLTLLLVTHDRYFLEKVCNKIIEIDRQQIFTYPASYSKYLEMRQNRILAMESELDKVKNILRKEQDWMSRQPQARAGKAKYRIDRYYELKDKSKVTTDEKKVNLTSESSYIGKKIFHAEDVCKSYGDKVILNHFTYDFARYEKIGIVGRNGVGKSTFVKLLQGLEKPDSGCFDVGQTVTFGYYSQERPEFEASKTVIEAVTDLAETVDNAKGKIDAMQYLQMFLFSPKDQQKYISTLSGGELSRLHLATVLMKNPNFLILDEPTNDLDIVTLGILEEYLSNFKGCAIIISHDRYFLDNIVDHLFVMEGDGAIRDFPGNYTEYREFALANDSDSKKEPARGPSKKIKTERPVKMTFNERREYESLTAEIEALTEEKRELERCFNEGTEINNIAEKSARYEKVLELLDAKELRWLELSEKE